MEPGLAFDPAISRLLALLPTAPTTAFLGRMTGHLKSTEDLCRARPECVSSRDLSAIVGGGDACRSVEWGLLTERGFSDYAAL